MPLTFGPFTLDHDTPTTRRAYAAIPSGGSETCTCAFCRSWNDGEVGHYYRREDGLHFYDGWYHGIGVMRSEPTSEKAIIDDIAIVIDWSDGSDGFFEGLRPYPRGRVSFAGFYSGCWMLRRSRSRVAG